jgi:LPXTG-site transpeptidase (sortase) family protein
VAPLSPALWAAAALLCAGCSGTTSSPVVAEVTPPAAVAQPGTPPPVRVGTPAASQRIRFVPAVLELPGGYTSPVDAASTVDGRLVVPESVRRVGWWDGGAQAGDPFGALVIAGHIDSATEGLGFFVRLLAVRPGDVVTVANVGHRASYRVVSVRSVPRHALSVGTFDQTGPHRLVLITCTGRYDRGRGGYERNLVLTALPTGPVRSSG